MNTQDEHESQVASMASTAERGTEALRYLGFESEAFVETGKSYSPRATLTIRGTINLSEGSCVRFNIGRDEYAILHYDRNKKAVIIQRVKSKEVVGARRIRRRTSGAFVSARPFLDKFELSVDVTTMYDIKGIAGDEFLVIDLMTGRERTSSDTADEESVSYENET